MDRGPMHVIDGHCEGYLDGLRLALTPWEEQLGCCSPVKRTSRVHGSKLQLLMSMCPSWEESA